jgi:hypothetical protein
MLSRALRGVGKTGLLPGGHEIEQTIWHWFAVGCNADGAFLVHDQVVEIRNSSLSEATARLHNLLESTTPIRVLTIYGARI